MRLTTKFSAFITLLTSLTIFVTLIGASLSFYNGIENKVENRVQAVATMLDNGSSPPLSISLNRSWMS